MTCALLGISTQCCGCRENTYLKIQRYKLNLNGPEGVRQSDQKVIQKEDTAYSKTQKCVSVRVAHLPSYKQFCEAGGEMHVEKRGGYASSYPGWCCLPANAELAAYVPQLNHDIALT